MPFMEIYTIPPKDQSSDLSVVTKKKKFIRIVSKCIDFHILKSNL